MGNVVSTAFHVVCNPTDPIYQKKDLAYILLLVQIDRTSRDMAFDLYNHSHCWKDITGHVFCWTQTWYNIRQNKDELINLKMEIPRNTAIFGRTPCGIKIGSNWILKAALFLQIAKKGVSGLRWPVFKKYPGLVGACTGKDLELAVPKFLFWFGRWAMKKVYEEILGFHLHCYLLGLEVIDRCWRGV